MLINVAITGFYYDAVEKAVMHNQSVFCKNNVLAIKPQMFTDNSSVFICG